MCATTVSFVVSVWFQCSLTFFPFPAKKCINRGCGVQFSKVSELVFN